MRRTHLLGCLAGIMAVIVLVAFSGFAQEDIKKVKDPAFKERTRGDVPFVHDEHNTKAKIDDCQVCHHTYENGKKVEGVTSEDKKCSECHLPQGKDSLQLIKAYHDRCKGCHMEKKAGPITCGECHPNR